MLNEATSRLRDLLESESPTSARVLLTTVFGDALLPHGQPVGVQALSKLMEPFEINERLVRTSLHRMTTEGLVTSERVGRKSYYQVHPESVATFDRANHRIYEKPMWEWDGQWTTVLLDPQTDPEVRHRVGRELRWTGLDSLAPGAFASPTITTDVVQSVFKRAGTEPLSLMRGVLIDGSMGTPDRLIRNADPDDQLRRQLTQHIAAFSTLASRPTSAPIDAFAIRILAINNWRRLVLRCPELPPQLVPTDWPESTAWDITAAIWHGHLAASQEYLERTLGTTATAQASVLERLRNRFHQ